MAGEGNSGRGDTANEELDWSTEPPPAYANAAHVIHTQREFSVFYSDMVQAAGRNSAPSTVRPRARIVSSLRFAPDFFFQMVSVLGSAWNRYAQSVAGRAKLPRFQLVESGDMQLDGLEDLKTAESEEGEES